jgi:hypothetical protein
VIVKKDKASRNFDGFVCFEVPPEYEEVIFRMSSVCLSVDVYTIYVKGKGKVIPVLS